MVSGASPNTGDNKVHYPPILGVIRPAFLLLTPVCVLLGVAVAYASDASVDWTGGTVAMISAVAAHVSVNALNEYEVLAFASLGLDVVAGLLPPTALIAMITFPVAVAVYRGVNRAIQASGPFTPALVPSLALNVVLSLLTPALFSAGMLFGF